MVEFKCTKEEYLLIGSIVKRAEKAAKQAGVKIDPMSLNMDLSAAHSNGCPLDFAKLLAFPDFDFAHDVFGIRRHINRETGELGNCFVPRCAKAELVA